MKRSLLKLNGVLMVLVALTMGATVTVAAQMAEKAEPAPIKPVPEIIHDMPHHTNGAKTNSIAPKSAQSKSNSSIAEYKKAMDKMHTAMMIPYTGDADVDFVRGMIPHHQGAIDMAKIVLSNGDDAAIKKLAAEIIAAQEKEIAMMQSWLAKNDKSGSAN